MLMATATAHAQVAAPIDDANLALSDSPDVHSKPTAAPPVKAAQSRALRSRELALHAMAPPPPQTTADLVDAPTPTRTWYGWQTLGTDAFAVASIAIAIASEEGDVLPGLGLGTYVLGGPIVHASHGNWGRAAGSFGMRTAFPVITGAVVYALNTCEPDDPTDDTDSDDWCELGWGLAALTGGVIGTSIASVIDASVLGWQREEPTPKLTPTLGVTQTSALLGVAGQF